MSQKGHQWWTQKKAMRTAYWSKYAKDHLGYSRARSARYRARHPDRVQEMQIRRWLKIKLQVIAYYSGGTMACSNPYGEHEELYTNILALSIDHIKGGGRKHKASLTITFYRWLIVNNFPPGFRVLCMNCQFIKRQLELEVPRRSRSSNLLPSTF